MGKQARLKPLLHLIPILTLGSTVLAACGGGTAGSVGPGTTATNPSRATGGGYLNAGASSAAFVQLTAPGTHLSAVMDTATLSGPAPNWAVSGSQIAMTGSENGSSVTFTINGVVATGQLTRQELTLDLPQQNGSLSPVHFVSATAAQYDVAVAKLRAYATKANSDYNYATSYVNHSLAQQCRSAGGTPSIQRTDPYVVSSCAVAGVQDSVQNGDSGGAAFDFSPSTPAGDAKECASGGGTWKSVAFGGYFTGQTGWDCVIGGFQDQVPSFTSGTFDVPLADAPAVVVLMNECTKAEGDFGLNESGTAFACLINGTTYDVIALSPQPHYATPLSVVTASGTSGASG